MNKQFIVNHPKYILVTWSDNVQEFMEYKWFSKECILNIISSPGYLIPEHRYFQVRKDEKDLGRHMLEQCLLIETSLIKEYKPEDYMDILKDDFTKQIKNYIKFK